MKLTLWNSYDQVVAGTNYKLTFSVRSPCVEAQIECVEMTVFEPLNVACDAEEDSDINPNCLRIVDEITEKCS
jgi:hypothetical protein